MMILGGGQLEILALDYLGGASPYGSPGVRPRPSVALSSQRPRCTVCA